MHKSEIQLRVDIHFYYDILTVWSSSNVVCNTFISLSYKTKDYCLQLAKPQLEQIGRKAPHSFLPFGEIFGSYWVTWHNFAKPYVTHHWTSHQLWLGRKCPQQGNCLDWIYPFQAILSNFGLCWQKSPPSWTGTIFWDWIYPFQAISSNFGFSWQKSHPSFLPFCETPSSCHTCGISMVPILQIHTQISPIQISSLGYQLHQLFKILT